MLMLQTRWADDTCETVLVCRKTDTFTTVVFCNFINIILILIRHVIHDLSKIKVIVCLSVNLFWADQTVKPWVYYDRICQFRAISPLISVRVCRSNEGKVKNADTMHVGWCGCKSRKLGERCTAWWGGFTCKEWSWKCSKFPTLANNMERWSWCTQSLITLLRFQHPLFFSLFAHLE